MIETLTNQKIICEVALIGMVIALCWPFKEMAVEKSCRDCDGPRAHRPAYPNLCEKHYRFIQMRAQSRWRQLVAPSTEELEALLPADMACPQCKRRMNWLNNDGNSTVITLQHDRSGKVRLMCRGCNARHAARPGDEFYEQDATKKRCAACGVDQTPENFYTHGKQKKWLGRTSYCKPCHLKKQREYAAMHPDRMAEYRRRCNEKRRLKRLTSG